MSIQWGSNPCKVGISINSDSILIRNSMWTEKLEDHLKEPRTKKRLELVQNLFTEIEGQSTKSELQPVDQNVRLPPISRHM